MKKYFIIGLLLIAAISFGQRRTWTETLALSGGGDTLTGTDTIIWATLNTEHYFGPGGSFEVKFHTLTANDATIGIVVANQDSLWHYVNASFPITLNKTTYGYSNEYGNTVSSWIGRLPDMYYRKIGVRFTKGTCTGFLIWYLYQQ